MAKFHINSNGDVKPCKATKISCQFGDDSLHFENEVDARKVAEKALEKAGPNALRGKKSSLKDLMKPATSFEQRLDALKKASATTRKTKATSKPQIVETPRQQITAQVKARELAKGFELVNRKQIPRDVERYLAQSAGRNNGVLAIFARDDERYKVLVEATDGRFLTYSTPDIKDVPHHTEVIGGWNMSVHPRGPKLSYRCARCSAVNQERLGNFTSLRQGDCRTRCRCGQLNSLPISQD